MQSNQHPSCFCLWSLCFKETGSMIMAETACWVLSKYGFENRRKVAKFLMMTFTCRSLLIYFMVSPVQGEGGNLATPSSLPPQRRLIKTERKGGKRKFFGGKNCSWLNLFAPKLILVVMIWPFVIMPDLMSACLSVSPNLFVHMSAYSCVFCFPAFCLHFPVSCAMPWPTMNKWSFTLFGRERKCS